MPVPATGSVADELPDAGEVAADDDVVDTEPAGSGDGVVRNPEDVDNSMTRDHGVMLIVVGSGRAAGGAPAVDRPRIDPDEPAADGGSDLPYPDPASGSGSGCDGVTADVEGGAFETAVDVGVGVGSFSSPPGSQVGLGVDGGATSSLTSLRAVTTIAVAQVGISRTVAATTTTRWACLPGFNCIPLPLPHFPRSGAGLVNPPIVEECRSSDDEIASDRIRRFPT